VSPLVGIIGAMQALETLKFLAGAGEPLIGRLLLWDGLRAEARVMRVPRDPACPVCGQAAIQAG
jgi:adenylyltransferase/sulfurtransferase